jgi:hypothetical protein
MTNIFQRFFGFVLHIKAKVSDAFVHLFGAQIASEIGHAALSAIEHTKLGKIVLEYVTEFNGPQYANLAGDIKRLQVVSKVEAWLDANNLSAATSVINLLIEFSIGKLKGYYDAAGPHDPTNPASTPPSTPSNQSSTSILDAPQG